MNPVKEEFQVVRAVSYSEMCSDERRCASLPVRMAVSARLWRARRPDTMHGRTLPWRTTMPLLDHFHPPLSRQRHWENMHSAWANALRDQLNEVLPERYFAEVQISLNKQIKIDVATFEEGPNGLPSVSRCQRFRCISVRTSVYPCIWSRPTRRRVVLRVLLDSRPHCFAAIVCASGRTTAGIMCVSTRSCKIRRWLRYDSTNSLKGCRPQYCRTVK